MRQVAELVETVFSASLDPAGRRMLRWMRRLGRLGWIGWLLNYWFLPPAARPYGFLWEANGRVVGNVNLSKVEGFPRRWALSNVAVHTDYRRQGIARSLVNASIDFVRRLGGDVILLQADRDSPESQVLYASFGFRPLATRTTWVRRSDRVPDVTEIRSARRRQREEWQQQWELAAKVHPEGLIWPYPTSSSFFRPYGFVETLGLGAAQHWVWSEEGQLIGSLTARRRLEKGSWRFILIVEPEARGRVEASLMALVLTELPTQGSIVLDYPTGVAEKQLESFGFHPEQTLTWMALEPK
ncbi:MAG TPA: GNAT family N-acetyltransferase [Anaerolineae bacterium]|nr:GNAT family N-acetyltransferase [Anaerolineae bacterium]